MNVKATSDEVAFHSIERVGMPLLSSDVVGWTLWHS